MRRRLSQSTSAHRYAGELIFQFRLQSDRPGTLRDVERRISVVHAKSALEAYKKLSSQARKSQFSFKTERGAPGKFEFCGISELIHLGVESDENEVWYSVKKMKDPVRRAKSLIPRKENLSALVLEVIRRKELR